VLLASIPVAIVVEYSVAYALWRGVRGRTLFRILYFLPVTLSWAVVGIVFRSILLEFDPTWLTNASTSLFVLVLAFHWAVFGINVLIMYAGLSTVDPALLEAATVDGAGSLRIMWRIVAPQARSFIDFVVMTTLILSLTNIFGLVYAFNLGGPGFGTTTLEFNLYQDGFTNGNFGLAVATGILLMLVAMIASLVSVVPTVRKVRR
jgi:ABC-type sugar transport system permease subunit